MVDDKYCYCGFEILFGGGCDNPKCPQYWRDLRDEEERNRSFDEELES